MKRDREGDVVPGTVPASISPSVNSHSLPLPRVPVSNGATTANGATVPKANGSGTIVSSGNGRKPRTNLDAGTLRPGPVTGLPTPGSAGGTSAPATASPSIPASLAPNVSSAPSSAHKRARFGIIEPPEGWREVAEGLRRAREQGEEPTMEEGEVTEKQTPRSHRQYAAVCSANFNRSMMAHKLMQKHGFRVESYGTGRDVRLPGKDVGSPEVFPFGTPYLEIYDTLKGKDEEFFRRNNLLGLVARNATIKTAPERFQDISGPAVANFDVVLCFDSRVFYLVVEDLQSRDPEMFKPLHVVNMTIKDSPEESAAAAGDVLEVCGTLDALDSLEDEAAEALDAFAKKTRRTILHQVCHV